MIFQDHVPDLFDLVRFPPPIFGLQVEDLLNTILGENVVIAFDALINPSRLSRARNLSNVTFASDLRIRMCSYSFSSLTIIESYHLCFFVERSPTYLLHNELISGPALWVR